MLHLMSSVMCVGSLGTLVFILDMGAGGQCLMSQLPFPYHCSAFKCSLLPSSLCCCDSHTGNVYVNILTLQSTVLPCDIILFIFPPKPMSWIRGTFNLPWRLVVGLFFRALLFLNVCCIWYAVLIPSSVDTSVCIAMIIKWWLTYNYILVYYSSILLGKILTDGLE